MARLSQKVRRLQVVRQQPLLSFACASLNELAEEIRQRHFPKLPSVPAIHFVESGTLACLVESPNRPPRICLHAVLNNDDVPHCVYAFVLKHELLHLQVQSREIDGKMVSHPPEFFDLERQIAPERDEAWKWICRTLWPRLKFRPRQECIDVLPPKRRRRALYSASDLQPCASDG